MLSTRILFQPGWKYTPATTVTDPLTGNQRPALQTPITGSGLLQDPQWADSANTETSTMTANDERMVLFAPDTVDISTIDIYNAAGQFTAPDGTIWQCITNGRARGIPGKPPEYIAWRARLAKEKT